MIFADMPWRLLSVNRLTVRPSCSRPNSCSSTLAFIRCVLAQPDTRSAKAAISKLACNLFTSACQAGSSFLHEQRQRSSVAVHEVLFADRTYLAVAKEPRQSQRAQCALHMTRIVMRPAEHTLAAAIATA